jgi:hypothetical protein
VGCDNEVNDDNDNNDDNFPVLFHEPNT